jgi:2,3-bisphosphoglycerate-independent phosphoglycerate mutase
LLKEKIEAIENFDREVVGTILNNLDVIGDCQILVTPDHPTPIAKRTHTSDPVPYVLYDSRQDLASPAQSYSEAQAKKYGDVVPGHQLLAMMISAGE